MKLVLKTGIFFLAAAMLFGACRPTAHKELGDPRNNVASLEGTWKLIRATQVDEDAAKKGFPFKEMDITNLFAYTDFIVKFNLSNGVPSTFTTTPGASPKLIKLLSGSWTVDDPAYPQLLTLTSGATIEKVTLGGYPIGPNNTLKLKVSRYDIPPPPPATPRAPKLLISYTYEFAKQ